MGEWICRRDKLPACHYDKYDKYDKHDKSECRLPLHARV